jgi:hypothetical protein
LRITRVYTGEDMRAYVEQVDVPAATPIPVGELRLAEVAAGEMPKHGPARRQFVIVLSGTIEVECANGSAEVRAGEILSMEDVEGEGHISRVSEGVRTVSVSLAEAAVVPPQASL